MSFKLKLTNELKEKVALAQVILACIDSRGDLLNKNGKLFETVLSNDKEPVLVLQGTPHGAYTLKSSSPIATGNDMVVSVFSSDLLNDYT